MLNTGRTDTSSIKLTRHAELRMRQRGFTLDMVKTVISASDRAKSVGNGRTALTLTRHALADMRADGIPAAVIDSARRCVIIVAEDETVVTVAKNLDGRRGRPYRRGRD
jgi:hypothetical protein